MAGFAVFQEGEALVAGYASEKKRGKRKEKAPRAENGGQSGKKALSPSERKKNDRRGEREEESWVLVLYREGNVIGGNRKRGRRPPQEKSAGIIPHSEGGGRGGDWGGGKKGRHSNPFAYGSRRGNNIVEGDAPGRPGKRLFERVRPRGGDCGKRDRLFRET